MPSDGRVPYISNSIRVAGIVPRASAIYGETGEFYIFILTLLFFLKSSTTSLSLTAEALTVTKIKLLVRTVNRCPLLIVPGGYFEYRPSYSSLRSTKNSAVVLTIVT